MPRWDCPYQTWGKVIIVLTRHEALPETGHTPSVRGFAECKNTGTRQTIYLPSARRNALGKRAVCRVSTREHSANHAFAECLLGALGKPPHPAIPFDGTVPAVMFAECTTLDTRQIHFFADCDTRQIFNKTFSSTFQTFVSVPTR